MTYLQQDIDFSTHKHENNTASMVQLGEHNEKFVGQNKRVYELLMAGQRLTVRSAMIELNIGDLRRRCADLRGKGIDVKSDTMPGGFKVYYIERN